MLQKFITKMKDPVEHKILLGSITDEELDETVELGMSIQESSPNPIFKIVPLRYITVLLATGYAYKDFKIKQGLNKLLEKKVD